MPAIGNNIDYTKRVITSWEGKHLSTTKVILNTSEVMGNNAAIQAEKTKSITQNGQVTITPSTGYDSMAKTKALTAAFSKVNVTYESTTDTILYDSKTFARYSDGDIELA